MEHSEIEVRFLEIDKDALIANLRALGAEDLGEVKLTEKIIYDKALTWNDSGKKFMRLRSRGAETTLTYKHRINTAVADGTEEIEFTVSDQHKAEALLERLGYETYRHQEKLRHSFQFGDVIVDIDTWPGIPPYVELEGESVEALQHAAQQLGFDWALVEMRDAKAILEEVYGIPLTNTRSFIF